MALSAVVAGIAFTVWVDLRVCHYKMTTLVGAEYSARMFLSLFEQIFFDKIITLQHAVTNFIAT